ncbi:MAG: MarR family winged helix-turn-helix transcriptional regulator [Chthoniobacterales bacterium]
MNTGTVSAIAPRESDALRADAERLSHIIMEMQRCFMLHLCKELAPGNVSFPQFFLLAALDHKEVLTMSAIAQKMGHTTAAASGLVARLENLGYVMRSSAVEDRRKVMVCITPKGSALVRRIREDMVGNLMKMMGYLTIPEQKAWVEIYSKIYNLCQNNGRGHDAPLARPGSTRVDSPRGVSQLERPRPRGGTSRRCSTTNCVA